MVERTILAIINALNCQNLAGLFGKADSGKSNTIKELARLFGKPVIEFNCSSEITLGYFTKMICGMMLSGTWICFKNIEKVEMQLLSVVANQLEIIRLAVNNKQEECALDGRVLALKY